MGTSIIMTTYFALGVEGLISVYNVSLILPLLKFKCHQIGTLINLANEKALFSRKNCGIDVGTLSLILHIPINLLWQRCSSNQQC